MKKLLFTLIATLSFTSTAYAGQITVPSAPGAGYCLKSVTNGTYTALLTNCSSGGGGSGSSTWGTTTSQVPAWFLNYSLNNTDIVTIGGSATSTAKFIFDPNTQIGYFSGNLGIGTKSPTYPLDVVGLGHFTGLVDASRFVATSSIASSFPYASTTAINATNAYLTKLGNLTTNGFVKTGSGDGTLSVDTNTYLTGSGAGVTSVSVASANGLAGSSSGGATPQLTLSTTINSAVLKGNGTAISGAVNGTDFTLITAKDCTSIGGHILSITAAGVSACSVDTYSFPQAFNGTSTVVSFYGGANFGASTTMSSTLHLDGQVFVKNDTAIEYGGGSGNVTQEKNGTNGDHVYDYGRNVISILQSGFNFGVYNGNSSTKTFQITNTGEATSFSSASNVFPYASSTALTVSGNTYLGTTNFTGITGSTQCLHVDTNGKVTGTGSDCGAGGGGNSFAWPFTPTTNFAVPVVATTGIVWFQNGLQASSTSRFVNASTTNITASQGIGTPYIYDASSVNRRVNLSGNLTDNSGVNTLDWQNESLNSSSGAYQLNWSVGQGTSGGVGVLDWGQQQLRNLSNIRVLDWNTSTLQDGSEGSSVEWANRLLKDSGAVTSIDWQNRNLNGSNTNSYLNWSNQLQFPQITGSTQCLHVDSSGTVSGTGSDCGAGGGGNSFAYPFYQTGNATTSVVVFNGGLTSGASTTINAPLRLPQLSQGQLNIGAGGLVYSGASTTFSSPLSYSNGAVTCPSCSTFSYPFPLAFNGTSTAVSLYGGANFGASTTINAALRLSSLGQGVLYTGTGGLVSPIATGTVAQSGPITVTAGQSVIGSGLTIGCATCNTSNATVSSIATNNGLTGGTITTSGTIGLDLTKEVSNTLQWWNGTQLQATGTQSLTVGYLIATTSTATSTFAGGITGPASFTVQQNSGWVGIASSSPMSALSVVGTTTLQGDLIQGTTGSQAFGVNYNGTVSVGTTTSSGALNIGTDASSASTTINMGKIQFDGYDTSGNRRCIELLTVVAGAPTWTGTSGACTP